MTQEEADKAAAKIEARLRRDGLWQKMDTLFATLGDGYIAVKEGDRVVAKVPSVKSE